MSDKPTHETNLSLAERRAVRVSGAALLMAWLVFAHGHFTRLPRDPVSALALGCLVVALASVAVLPSMARGFERLVLAPPRVAFVAVAAIAAFALSLWFVHSAMKGQVLALDSAVYLMQARALAHGHFGMPIPAPALPFGARFLFEGADARMHGVFPPGYPLFLAPFVAAGHALAAGPVTAALLVLAQYALGRAVTRDELPIRLSILLSMPSFARVIETADLLSHAWVAVLAALAVAAALQSLTHRSWKYAIAIGACVGWAFASRLLDGLVIGCVCGGVIVHGLVTRRLTAVFPLVATLAAIPFVLLVAVDQHAATGAWTTPTQTEYFARSDWPATCHRLGFGRDVGCRVEHPGERESFGPDGYTLTDALLVARSRAFGLGSDLFGLGALATLAFVVLLLRPAAVDVPLAASVIALTAAYSLFYYGNAPFFGARHLFPAAPFVWLLVARALIAMPHRKGPGWFDQTHVRGGVALAVTVTVALAHQPRRFATITSTRDAQSRRVDVRATIASQRVERGIVATRDFVGYIAAFDPWQDARELLIVNDDRSGLRETRRIHPLLPMILALPGGASARAQLPPPPPGVLIELEAAWPSFQRVSGLGALPIDTSEKWGVASSGSRALHVFASRPGATLTVPFEVAIAGRYSLRVDGVAGPDFGTYELAVDGDSVPPLPGYASQYASVHGAAAGPRWLSAGRHVFTARCTGRAAESGGYLAAFDAIVGLTGE